MTHDQGLRWCWFKATTVTFGTGHAAGLGSIDQPNRHAVSRNH